MTTAKEDAYARKYYKTNSKYRKKKIEDRKEYAKSHKKEEAEQSRVSAYNKSHRTKKRK